MRSKEEYLLQAQCEAYLRVRGLRFVHIPSKIQLFIWSPVCPKWVGALASRYLKGIPDLLIFGYPVDGVRQCLTIELKSEKGKLTDEQKQWSPIICRNFEQFRQQVDLFLRAQK
jgi:hypothetical protein